MQTNRRRPSSSWLLLFVLLVGISSDWFLSKENIATLVWSYSFARTSLSSSVRYCNLHCNGRPRSLLWVVAKEEEEVQENSIQPSDDPTTLRVSELKAQLKEWNVPYKDCFDKESLVARYKIAQASGTTKSIKEEEDSIIEEGEEATPEEEDATELSELRQRSVKELRTLLGSSAHSRTFLEKEDLVQAVRQRRRQPFSVTGALSPGTVTEVTGALFRAERAASATTPLLLKVYATWCGPCQIMVPPLQELAAEFGSTLRMAQLDSDRETAVASELRIQGLPTLILFNNEGKEIDRLEGALMKEQLRHWIRSRI